MHAHAVAKQDRKPAAEKHATNRPTDWQSSSRDGDSPRSPRLTVCPCGGGCPRCKRQSSNESMPLSGSMLAEVNGQLLPLQAKLEIGAVDDPLEREADEIAEKVMPMPDPAATNLDTSDVSTNSQAEHPTPAGLGALVQRKPVAPQISRFGSGPAKLSMTAPPIVHEALRSPGRVLDNEARAFFEPRFGRDLSHVRVHTDAKAAASARSINANAYTAGSDIVFGSGQYAPDTSSGRRLIAHELTHTLQSSGPVRRQPHTDVTDPPATLEGLEVDAKHEVSDTWTAAAVHGIQRFVDSQLIDRLKALEKRGEEARTEFFIKLAEVAVALIPGGGEVVEGVKTVTEITVKFADLVTHIPEGLEKHPDLETLRNKCDHAVYQGADAILRDIDSTAAAILAHHPGITHNQALALLLEHYFKDKPSEVFGGQEGMIEYNPPRLNKEVIARRMEHTSRWASLLAEKSLSERLEEKEPGNNLSGNIRTEVAFVQAPDGNIRLALLRTDYSLYRSQPSNPEARGQPKFIDWVPVGEADAALALQHSKLGIGPPLYSFEEAKLFMVPWRPPELIEWLKEHGA